MWFLEYNLYVLGCQMLVLVPPGGVHEDGPRLGGSTVESVTPLDRWVLRSTI
jgi:hypothetical protein